MIRPSTKSSPTLIRGSEHEGDTGVQASDSFTHHGREQDEFCKRPFLPNRQGGLWGSTSPLESESTEHPKRNCVSDVGRLTTQP